MSAPREKEVEVGIMAAFRDDALDVVESQVGSLASHPDAAAEDERFWLGVRQAFTLDPDLTNFNNGGCSPSPRVVAESLKRQIDFANKGPSIYMWRTLEPEIEGVRKRLAKLFGVDPEEVAITRNASESLMTCLFGLPLNSGDEILTSSQDYPRMINAIRQLERRIGIKMVQAEVPTAPLSKQAIVDAFEQGITPRTKIILISHVGFMNGQINPVREVCDLGRKHGIPVVVDGAHALCHFPFKQADLTCDYFGTSLHKWLMAPIGTGLLYVRRPLIVFSRDDRGRAESSAAALPAVSLDQPVAGPRQGQVPYQPGSRSLMGHLYRRGRRHPSRRIGHMAGRPLSNRGCSDRTPPVQRHPRDPPGVLHPRRSRPFRRSNDCRRHPGNRVAVRLPAATPTGSKLVSLGRFPLTNQRRPVDGGCILTGEPQGATRPKPV